MHASATQLSDADVRFSVDLRSAGAMTGAIDLDRAGCATRYAAGRGRTAGQTIAGYVRAGEVRFVRRGGMLPI